MKKNMKQEKGISLISLGITVVIMVLLTTTLVYNAKDSAYIRKLNDLYSDIGSLREKVSAFYNEYGKIPAKVEYIIADDSGLRNVLTEKEKVNKFYVVDLQAMENITLNYGRDYEYVKDKTSTGESEYKDIYIISSYSNNIFYAGGVIINENVGIKVYYTDYVEADNTEINLRYVYGIRIPEEYYYIGDTEEGNIVISKTKDDNIDIDNNQNQYKWVKTDRVPTNVTLNENQNQTEFETSIQVYNGYFINKNNDVVYIIVNEDIWSETYTVTTEYTDEKGDTVYIPAGFKVSMSSTMNKLDNGLVIQDENKNEWVWIQVPKKIFTTAKHNTDYDAIEKDLIEYAKDYRKGSSTQDYNWKDEWYAMDEDTVITASTEGLTSAQKALNNGCGLTYDEYMNLYQTMLTSVYTNQGFWISRYEIGDKEATLNNETRTSSYGITSTPVSIANQIPYNYVTCSQAQTLASKMKTADKTSSLLFGIQWDLVCKFLEEASYLTYDDIATDSTNWGNYSNSSLLLYRGKYNINPTRSDVIWTLFTTDKTNYVTSSKTSNDTNYSQLLTTGASKQTNKMNIYDLAGNENEWTLENASNTSYPSTCRGGRYGNIGSKQAGAYRGMYTVDDKARDLSFRATLY